MADRGEMPRSKVDEYERASKGDIPERVGVEKREMKRKAKKKARKKLMRTEQRETKQEARSGAPVADTASVISNA